MKVSSARFTIGVALPVAGLATPLATYVLLRGQLPDRVATHFDAAGTPDGSMTPTGFLLFTMAFVAAGAGTCVWLARRSPIAASVAPIIGFLGGFFVGLGSAIGIVTFVGQRNLERWEEADGVLLLVVIPLVVAALTGALAARAATALPSVSPEIATLDQPVMDLDEGQHAVWAHTMHSAWLARLGAAAMVVGVAVGIATYWPIMIGALITGIITLSLATLQVRADKSGLHVKYGALPWPRTSVAVGDIAAASVIDVRPMEWGGWGYRGSLKLMKQAAVVHRAGPGIRVDLRDGKVFVVTIDDPQTPVALLNAEIAGSPQPA